MNTKQALFRVLDTETTGLDPATAAVCELGMVDVMYSDVLGVERWFPVVPRSWLCNPGIPIPAEAKAVHHILDADVAKQPHVKFRIVDEIETAPGNAVFVAHNVKYDRPILEREGMSRAYKWLCTHRLAMHVWPDAPSYKNEVLRYWLGFEKLPFGTLYAHRAEHDVLVTALVLAKALHAIGDYVIDGRAPREANDVDALIAWANSPVVLKGKLGFGKHFDLTWAEVAGSHGDYFDWMIRQAERGEEWDMDKLHTARHYRGRLL